MLRVKVFVSLYLIFSSGFEHEKRGVGGVCGDLACLQLLLGSRKADGFLALSLQATAWR